MSGPLKTASRRQRAVTAPPLPGLRASVVSSSASPAISRATVDMRAAEQTAMRPGMPLSGETRSWFEPRFGHDFSHVRVHADGEAAHAAHSVQARAYTLGRDIVFNSGEYTPQTHAGKELLAHELAHVVQQGRWTGSATSSGHAPVLAASRAVQFQKQGYPKVVTIANAAVRVASSADEAEAAKIIDAISLRFDITFDSQKGLKTLKDSVKDDPDEPQTMGDALAHEPRRKVKDLLDTSEWSLAQLRDLAQGLAFFQPALGPLRSLTPGLGSTQPLTTLSRLNRGLNDSRDATSKSVFGQFFGSASTAAIYDASGSATELADKTKASLGVVVHEVAHAVFGAQAAAFVSSLKPPYWKDANTRTNDAAAEKPVTGYGSKNAAEDMADAVMFHFLERSTLQKQCPQRAVIVDALVKAWQPPGPKP